MSEESSMCVHWYRTLYSWIASAMLVRMSMVFYASAQQSGVTFDSMVDVQF